MHVLKVGRHRLDVTIRLDRIPSGAEAELAWRERNLRREGKALREHWERELIPRVGWIR